MGVSSGHNYDADHYDSPSSINATELRRLGAHAISLEETSAQYAAYAKWLRRERGIYVDELSKKEVAKYYRRFARRWNDGALSERYYRISRPPSRSASPPRASSSAARNAKHGHASRSASPDDVGPSLPSQPGSSRSYTSIHPSSLIGPSAPTRADILLAREDASAASHSAYKASLKSSYSEANELVPKGVGKEGKMEEKRAAAAANKAFADKEADREAAVDESTLMGSGGGFAEAIRKRDAAKLRREQEREAQMREKMEGDRERLEERRKKEEGTMAMRNGHALRRQMLTDRFREMAKSRFG